MIETIRCAINVERFLYALFFAENATTFDVHKLESCVVNVTGDNRPVKLRIRAKVLIRKNGLLVKRRYGGLTIRGWCIACFVRTLDFKNMKPFLLRILFFEKSLFNGVGEKFDFNIVLKSE